MISRKNDTPIRPGKLAVWLVLGIVIAGIISGCQTRTGTDNWPYKGVPMIGTNAIPAPRY